MGWWTEEHPVHDRYSHPTPEVEHRPGPERVYDNVAAAEPVPERGPIGFAPPPPLRLPRLPQDGLLLHPDDWRALQGFEAARDQGPLLWEGDQA